jgi:beta-N-acetylhexosaminidase
VRGMTFWARIARANLAVAAAVLMTVAAASCDGLRRQGPTGAGAAASAGDRRPGSTASAGPGGGLPVAAVPAGVLGRLSERQLAGQRVIYSYRGLRPPARLLRLIRDGEAAGVMFFGQNIASKTQLAAVIRELQRADAAPGNPVRAPLLLMTDQEGGLVRRLPGAPALSEKQIGESADPEGQATAAGAGAAANLRGVGMNVNLAPVLDVYRTPGDFDDQFQRSYSSSPAAVARLGADFITAQQRAGVAATAKHFPGLGAASQREDTDLRPVTLRVPLRQLRAVDELPYRSAIAAGVRLVMVSWAIYPALDPRRPAGLSPVIVGGELRDRLHFDGVTITDALEAGALRPFGGFSRRGLLAARAGMDLLLCSGRSIGEGELAAAGLLAGYRDGQLGRRAFLASVARILGLRYSLHG